MANIYLYVSQVIWYKNLNHESRTKQNINHRSRNDPFHPLHGVVWV